jgi:hypothetical protein
MAAKAADIQGFLLALQQPKMPRLLLPVVVVVALMKVLPVALVVDLQVPQEAAELLLVAEAERKVQVAPLRIRVLALR